MPIILAGEKSKQEDGEFTNTIMTSEEQEGEGRETFTGKK